jgi:hypothetical protein
VRRLFSLLILTSACNLPAQTTHSRSFAGLVLSELGELSATPDLAVWHKLHPNERLRSAAYDNEYETQGRWCAASVAEFVLPGDIKGTRQALFYIPSGKASDPLPSRQDPALVQQCRLLALWYEVKNPPDEAELAKSVSAGLGASLGPAEEPPPFKRTDHDWGSGYWQPYVVWERENRRVVIAVDPGGPGPAPGTLARRLLVIARSSLAPRGMSFEWMGSDAPSGQAALDGAGESSGVARIQHPCSFDDSRNNWQSAMIRFGEKLLRDFPDSPWRSYIHLQLARTYAAWLMLTYPGVELEGANRPAADPDTLRRNAIAHFRTFLDAYPKEKRDSPEADSAWRETWRLLAGLPPSPIHFACTD